MTLKEIIKADMMYAMRSKNNDKKLLLSTLLGELDRKGKDAADADVIKEINKMIENCKLCNKENEVQILQAYIPVKMTLEKLESLIAEEIKAQNYSGMQDMGKIMKYLSTTYAGLYDGKDASDIVKRLLTK